MTNLDVEVYRGSVHLSTAERRPARRLPNGFVGVVVYRTVRPVYKHRFEHLSIDLNDVGYDRDLCPHWNEPDPYIFFDEAAAAHDLDDLEHYIETNTYGHYVVFDGDESVLNEVLARLRDHRLVIRRYGESHRPADNGHHYHWFVRLGFDGSRDEVIKHVAAALTSSGLANAKVELPADAEVTSLIGGLSRRLQVQAIEEGLLHFDAPTLVAWLGQIADDSYQENIVLQLDLDSATSRAADLQQDLANSEISAVNSIRMLNSEIEALRQKRDRREDAQLSVAALEAENLSLRAKVIDQDAVFEEWQAAELRFASLKTELQGEKQARQELAGELEHLRSFSRRSLRPSERVLMLIRMVLSAFSNIDIHKDAADTIMERFHRLEAIRDVLHRLNDGASVPATRITTAPGWMEVAEHIGTGQSNRGRVYYKRQDGGRLLVVVHFKGDNAEQQRFFEKLNDPRFLQVQSFDAA